MVTDNISTSIYNHIKSLKEYLQDKNVMIYNEEEEELRDVMYDLPQYWNTDRHGYHREYAVTGVSNNRVQCICIGDDFGETLEIGTGDLEILELLALAQMVEEKESTTINKN